jgi:hypothetical protein
LCIIGGAVPPNNAAPTTATSPTIIAGKTINLARFHFIVKAVPKIHDAADAESGTVFPLASRATIYIRE